MITNIDIVVWVLRGIAGFLIILIGIILFPEVNKEGDLVGGKEDTKRASGVSHKQNYLEYVQERHEAERMMGLR